MKSYIVLGALASSFLSQAVIAEESAQEKSPFEVSAELGLLIKTGNTESTSVFGNLTVLHELTSWNNKYTLDITKKEEDIADPVTGNKNSETTDEKYKVTAQGDYGLSDTSALFIFGSYTDDKFGSYKEYTTVAAGYSYRAFEKENMHLDVNVGPGYSEAVLQDGTKEDGVVVRGSAAFKWNISETAKFTQNISVESADYNTRTITETALVSSLNSSLQMKFGFKTVTDSDVAPGSKKTDTETSATVIVNF